MTKQESRRKPGEDHSLEAIHVRPLLLVPRAAEPAPIIPTMRLTDTQATTIRQLTAELAGPSASVRLFGSRLDDGARGGDVDLFLEVPTPVDEPALLAARLAARVSRALDDRRVDVLISAPNLARLPIHELASKTGQRL